MTDFQRAIACLPAPLRDRLQGVPAAVQDRVQEIRLRAGAPVELSGRRPELAADPKRRCDRAAADKPLHMRRRPSCRMLPGSVRIFRPYPSAGDPPGLYQYPDRLPGGDCRQRGDRKRRDPLHAADHLHLPAGGPAAYGCADPLAQPPAAGRPDRWRIDLRGALQRQNQPAEGYGPAAIRRLPGQAVSRGGGGRAGGAGRGPGTAGMRCAALLPQGEGDRAGGALPGARRGAVR